MAMSVAEQPVAEKAPRSPQTQLAMSSLLGAVFVLGSLWVVFGGLPYAWGEYLALANEFLSAALLLIVSILVGCGLWYVGYQLEKKHAVHGVRAGIFFASLLLFLAGWLTLSVIGSFLETRDLGAAGAIVTAAIGLGFAYGIYWIFTRPGFAGWLRSVEDQGWFHALPYKPTQGVRVRRGTVLAVLVLGICGIITLISHHSLGYERAGGPPNNWEWPIPFTAEEPRDDAFIPLMFKVHLVVPLVLGVGLLWIAWRVVNWPTFADFLIATEAEMNKVSWTTRKRLVQDTIVVLVTVFLLTAFLFFVDILWIKVLSNPWFQVLHVDLKAEQQKQQEKSQW
jgi:preprotein translocase SecE subunit